MIENKDPSMENGVPLLGHPHIASNIAAGAELLLDETSVSTDVIESLTDGDSLEIDCGDVRYTLVPTKIDDPTIDTQGLWKLFLVSRAQTDKPKTEAQMREGSIIMIDGTSAMPTGTMMRPKLLVRNGYLAFRKPLKAREEDLETIRREGLELTPENFVKFGDGKIMWNPSPRASELMYHIDILRADGTKTTLF
jgi:hypothetical protein